jgi:hypothetical protein
LKRAGADILSAPVFIVWLFLVAERAVEGGEQRSEAGKTDRSIPAP